MRNLVGILIVIVLVVVGVGVVRPHTVRLMHEAWEPVMTEQIEVPLDKQASVELNQTGDYVVFLEGPAGDALWDTAAGEWLQLVDWQTHHPLRTTRQGVDYSFELDGKRSQSLSRVTVAQAGTYEASLGDTALSDLHARGFQLTVSPAKLVVEHSRQATTWMIGGIAVGILMGIFGLGVLTSRQA